MMTVKRDLGPNRSVENERSRVDLQNKFVQAELAGVLLGRARSHAGYKILIQNSHETAFPTVVEISTAHLPPKRRPTRCRRRTPTLSRPQATRRVDNPR